MLISEVLHPKQVYFICLHKELLHKTFHSDILHVAYPCLSARHKDTPSPAGGGVGGAAGGGTRPARVICNQISMIQSPRVRFPGEPRSPAPASAKTITPAKLQTRSRHKRQSLSATQPVRFNVPISAFIGVSAKLHYSGREPFSPAPTFPPVGAGGVFP